MQHECVLGIDGCPDGWVVASLQGHDSSIEYWSDLSRLGAVNGIVMIDMPIGLPDGGYRRCDLEARALLQENRSRVFLGARRPLLQHSTYEEANLWGKSVGCGVSRQLFGILCKLRQVDQVVETLGQSKIKETHPELVFLRLNGFVSLPSKKTDRGAKVRKEIIRREGFKYIDFWLAQRKLRAKPDDVLDACVAALAARDFAHKVPEIPEVDAKGFAMEIWY